MHCMIYPAWCSLLCRLAAAGRNWCSCTCEVPGHELDCRAPMPLPPAWPGSPAGCLSTCAGGSVNYVAVSEQLSLSPGARMAGLAADDLIVSLYFLALYWLARQAPPDPEPGLAVLEQQQGPPPPPPPQEQQIKLQQQQLPPSNGEEADRRGITVLHGATALALAAVLCHLGTQAAAALNYRGGSITVITALTVTLVTCFPRQLAPLASSGEGLAAILMQACRVWAQGASRRLRGWEPRQGCRGARQPELAAGSRAHLLERTSPLRACPPCSSSSQVWVPAAASRPCCRRRLLSSPGPWWPSPCTWRCVFAGSAWGGTHARRWSWLATQTSEVRRLRAARCRPAGGGIVRPALFA
jgi:hypothetical protein